MCKESLWGNALPQGMSCTHSLPLKGINSSQAVSTLKVFQCSYFIESSCSYLAAKAPTHAVGSDHNLMQTLQKHKKFSNISQPKRVASCCSVFQQHSTPWMYYAFIAFTNQRLAFLTKSKKHL